MKKTFKGPSRLHLALNIRQLDPSVKFYEALFNLKASKVKPGYAKFEVEDPLNVFFISKTFNTRSYL